MPGDTRSKVYCFDRVVVDPAQRRIVVDGKPAAVAARAFDLLLMLVERPGTLVRKEEIFDRVWAGVIVEDGNLQVQVFALRKIIGGDAIENVPGRGYRFTREVTSKDADVPSSIRAQPLPHQATSFVGREDELAELRRLLESARLLTLLGAGGIGKTRLCLQLASELAGDFSDGVAFVDLAPMSDPMLVAPGIAAAIGVGEEPGRAVLDTLVDRLGETELLLLLDNCEHLLDECARLCARLLQRAPKLRIVATSREPLRVRGETSYPVPTLQAPDPSASAVDSLTRFPAAKLFLERAMAARATFKVSEENAQAIARICRDLDGIPLALELAATRVRAMSVEAIAERLTDRFRLLKNRDQSALPRHQTLRATIDWSYGLLADEARVLLGRLALFASGFTLEAAERVAACGVVREEDVLDLLAELVEKSLVVHEPATDRYRLLETVRQYALERLREAGEEDATSRRFVRWLVELAQAAELPLLGSEQAEWHTRLDLERDNILAGFACCERVEGGTLAGLDMIHALRPWMCWGSVQVWYRVCDEVLARPSAREHPKARDRGAYAIASIAYYLGRYDAAFDWSHEVLAAATRDNDRMKIADAHIVLGAVCLARGDMGAAEQHFAQGLALANAEGDRMRRGDASVGLAELLSAKGDYERAEPLYVQAIADNLSLGNREGAVVSLVNLARIAVARDEAAAAAKRLREAFDVGGTMSSAQIVQMIFTVAAGLAALLREWSRAAGYFGAAEAQLTRHGIRREPADATFIAPLIASTRDALGNDAFEAQALAGQRLGEAAPFADISEWLAGVPVKVSMNVS